MVAKLLPLLPPHRIYVEPFGGGASLLFAKEPSPVEVYSEIEEGLVNLFRVLRDPEKFGRFYHLATLTPYSREEWEYCQATWEACEDEVERAYRFFVTARQSFGGRFDHGWGMVVTTSNRGMAGTCSRWLSILALLPAIHERLRRVQIEHEDYRVILDRYDTPETLFFCDPPYVPETRRAGEYRHEMSLEDHKELVTRLLALQGKVLLSGYAHEVYRPLEEAGWERKDFPAACHAVGRTRNSGLQGRGAVLKKQPRLESVWISPTARKGSGSLLDFAGPS
jgi:DNA adenine methylase